MDKLYPVYTLNNECHDCYKCVRQCHVKAISIQQGHASVLPEKCIACGNCVQACPNNAKRVRNDIDKVKNLFRAQQEVYVSLAPSWSGIFDYTPSKMIALLKKLGFKHVSETALGAQEVSIECAKLMKEKDKGLFISSACPVVVDYIRLYNTKFLPCITPVASPALTHAKMLKEMYGSHIHIVFIGPCIAKKNESDHNPDLIDVALTFEELKFWLQDEFISADEVDETGAEAFVPQNAYEGALYPIEGGMNETIKKGGMSDDVQFINVSSIENLEKTLKGLDPANVNKKIFIEALSCNGGCLAGPCASTKKPELLRVSDALSKVKSRDIIPNEPATVVEKQYVKKQIEHQNHSYEKISEALKKIGKYSEEDELNCGGCGYNTCRELACALLSGEAEPSMCVSYMRKIAMQKAAAMLRCMPSAIVMVDKDLRIVESNEAFMKMFCSDMYDIFSDRPEGLNGACIDRIVDFSDIFKETLKTERDIHKEHYAVKNRLYDISAFSIEKNELAGAIITDVTQSEMGREKIAQKAHEVINKNIAIVQEIACLLGEHMVETELLLSTIAQDYDTSDEDKK